MQLKIFIVDDHEAAREGLKQLLIGTSVEVAGAYASKPELLASLEQTNVDAVVADVRMPVAEGLMLLAEIRESKPTLPVVMLSAFDNPTYVARAVALGAQDFLLKSVDRTVIIESIQRSAAGLKPPETSLFYRIHRLMKTEAVPTAAPSETPLTSREAQVYRHVGLGLSNREIAKSLDISIETVKEHVQNMLRKINAGDRTEAAVRAVRMGLIDY